jgi:hypothetical protein
VPSVHQLFFAGGLDMGAIILNGFNNGNICHSNYKHKQCEYPEVLKQAMETYHIESAKMMRYARRRGREDEMKKILEEIEAAEA